MPEEVSILEDLGIIHVYSYGEVTEGDLLASMEEVLAIHRQRGFSKVLVDASKETSLPSTPPLHRFGSLLSENATVLKLAVVVSDAVRDDLHFLVTAAQDRGMHVKIFDTREQALAWLKE